MRRCISAALCVAAMLLHSPARAQHALVLSGGGARGLAHAGALVALEELGYRPDLVVGTSMGAIIGALYAAGYSSPDIWRIIADEDWLERFAAEPIIVGTSRTPRRPLLSFGVNTKQSYEGLLPTTGVNRRLVELLFDAGVRARNDFDRLPLRYRAIAADLSTGDQVVLDRGDLPRAVRASMAVPGAFAPVRWGNSVLIDGGIANNLPVSVADSLTAAPIIAIDVVRPVRPAPERSAVDLGVRAIRLLIENARPQVEPDILVLPQLGSGFAETRFPADATYLLRAGYDAVRDTVPPLATPQPDARRANPAVTPDITRIVTPDADAATARLVARFMEPAVGAYDAAVIVRRVSALYATGLFQAVWPVLRFAEGSADTASLEIDAVTVAQTSLAGSVRWDSDLGAGTWLSLRQRVAVRTPWELRAGGDLTELRTAGNADVSVFSSRVPGLIINAGVHGGEERVRTFDGDSITGTLPVTRLGASAGIELHGPVRDLFVSALARAERIDDDVLGLNGDAWGVFFRIARPSQPDRVVGAEPLVELDMRTGDVRYVRAHVRFGTAQQTRQLRHAWFVDVAHATSGAPFDARPAMEYDLAPWLRAGALRAPLRAVLAADVAYPFVLDGYLRARVRVVGSGTTGFIDERDAWSAGVEVGAMWPTVVGPLSIAVARGTRGTTRFHISVGGTF